MASWQLRPCTLLVAASLVLQVWRASGASETNHFTASPLSLTVNVATDITFTAAGTIDTLAKLDIQLTSSVAGGECGAAPATLMSAMTNSGGNTAGATYTHSFTLTSTGINQFSLCYRKHGESDSKAQASQTFTVVAATPSNKIAGVHPLGIYATQATSITFSGTVSAGDKAAFALDCTSPGTFKSLNSGTNAATTFTMGSTGYFFLCYRNSGGSDAVQQGTFQLQVVAAGGAGADPVTWYNDKKHIFELPSRTLVPLLESQDMKLSGETFAYGGEWQQWFGRMVLYSPDGSRWVQISIKKNILEFNRSRIPQYAQGHFETLDVILGHGPIDNPSATTVVTDPDVRIPLNFLGFDVVFWKMARSAKVSNTMIGAAHRECMEVAGANMHFYVCSSAAHEFWGWQRDLSIVNAHLDIAVIEMLNGENLKGLLPELWGIQPMSEKTKSYLVDDHEVVAESSSQKGIEVPTLPEGSLPSGKAWAGGSSHQELLQTCVVNNQTVLGCEAPLEENQTVSVNIMSV